MQVKKIAQVVWLVGMLALTACSSMSRHGNVTSGGAAGDEAAATGLGTDEGMDGDTSQSASRNRTFYFDFDRSDVRDSDRPAILANADYLVANPSKSVIVEGHTDPRGSREYNVALGERRANAVYDILKARGVHRSQVRVVSYGAERLAEPGHTETAYQRDRRAVISTEQG